MVDPTQSITAQQADWEKDAPFCDCNRNQKVMYICLNNACPNVKTQRIYCLACFQDGKHAHFPPMIIKDNFKHINDSWAAFKQSMEEAVHTSNYKQWAPLIKYLEAMRVEVVPAKMRWMSRDWSELVEMLALVEKLAADVEEKTFRKRVLELFMLDLQHFSKLAERFEVLKYINKVSEDFLYENYQQQLQVDSALPFDQFDQSHRDAYLRLKLRCANSRIPLRHEP